MSVPEDSIHPETLEERPPEFILPFYHMCEYLHEDALDCHNFLPSSSCHFERIQLVIKDYESCSVILKRSREF